MKNTLLLFGIVISTFILSAFNSNSAVMPVDESFVVPENISAILDKSCVMCHNSESSNTKAKMKLKFEDLADMKVSKQISKLSKIAKEVNKGDMPPEKFTAKYPDKALTAEEKESLINWAKSYSAELAK